MQDERQVACLGGGKLYCRSDLARISPRHCIPRRTRRAPDLLNMRDEGRMLDVSLGFPVRDGVLVLQIQARKARVFDHLSQAAKAH